MTFIVKNWKGLVVGVILSPLFLILLYFSQFLEILRGPVNTAFGNLAIEVIGGLIFAIAPLLFGVSYGKRFKELEFYSNVENVFRTLIKLRENGLIEPQAVRLFVQRITKQFGNEAVKQQWVEKAALVLAPLQLEDTKICRICTLEAKVKNHKCKFCELNCYAWDLSSQAEHDKEDEEVKRIIESVRLNKTK